MRNVIVEQMTLGEADIGNIQFDPMSRDEIPKLLKGLQHIYLTDELRNNIFRILKDLTPKDVDPNNGRTGMDYWKILVLGILRLGCNWDYDKLKEIADQHCTVRQMMGHSIFDENKYYPLQTIRDNIALLTPEVLERINREVVKHGHCLLGKTELDDFNARCDSFVVETNVHYPTDINLLLDAMGKVIHLTGLVCASVGITDWRQSAHSKGKVKKLYRKAQQAKRSNSKDPKKRAAKEKLVREAYSAYLETSVRFLAKTETTIKRLREDLLFDDPILHDIERYMEHAFRQIEQTSRRVLDGEKIRHDEKVFSIFEEHTEWISKGKAGVPQELGLRVCILQDQYGFICHHRVMREEVDVDVALPMVLDAKELFANLSGCSFDKGFYSPDNRKILNLVLNRLCLPKKGKLSEEEKRTETTDEYLHARRKHSAVESAINALEHSGLDRCPDKGIDAFLRYVSLGVLSRNIQTLGAIVQRKEREQLERERRRLRAA